MKLGAPEAVMSISAKASLKFGLSVGMLRKKPLARSILTRIIRSVKLAARSTGGDES